MKVWIIVEERFEGWYYTGTDVRAVVANEEKAKELVVQYEEKAQEAARFDINYRYKIVEKDVE
jgi:hypothetical protein